MKKNKYIKNNKKGFVAVETILSSTVCLSLFVLFAGFLAYMTPRIMLEKEVQDLAQIAKKQGGLTDSTSQPVNSDVDRFKDALASQGYDRSKITVTAIANPSNKNAIGVTPLTGSGKNYITRDNKDLITITVVVPSDSSLFKIPFSLMGFSKNMNNYIITETVGSERW